MRHLGLPDRFIEHGDPVQLLALQGLDANGIESSVRSRLGQWLVPQQRNLKAVS